MPRMTIETDQLDEAAAIMHDQYRVRLGLQASRHSLRLVQDSVSPAVQLTHAKYQLSAALECAEGLPQLYFTRLNAGRLSYRIGQVENRWEPGDLFVASPAMTPFDATVEDADCDFLAIDPGSFSTLVQTGDGTAVTLTGYEPVSAQAAATWSRTYNYVQHIVRQPEIGPLVTAATTDLLAAVTLETFPNNAQTEPTSQDRLDAHPATLRRAIGYIDQRLDQDISLPDIAAACYVTPRTLQLAFRRHLSTTPMAYIRRARLDQAHRDLLAADPHDGPTVTSIARRWGFGDPGRFTQHYQRTFGELPSQTLRR